MMRRILFARALDGRCMSIALYPEKTQLAYPKFYARKPLICKLLLRSGTARRAVHRAEMGLHVPPANTLARAPAGKPAARFRAARGALAAAEWIALAPP